MHLPYLAKRRESQKGQQRGWRFRSLPLVHLLVMQGFGEIAHLVAKDSEAEERRKGLVADPVATVAFQMSF